MNHLPLFLEIKDRPVLVVGGGDAAARRVETALKAGGLVTAVAIEAGPALKDLAKQDGVDLQEREFRPADLEGRVLVFVATEDEDLNGHVSALAQDAGIPVNVADRLSLCTFIMPAVIDRSPILVAVSSGGEAPILSRVLRARLETFVPAGLGRLARFAGAVRDRVQDAVPAGTGRRRFWEDFIDGPIAE